MERLSAALRHRGPDDDGLVQLDTPGAAVGLCARRLAIQDPSPLGHQPANSPLTGSWICFNGELYNAPELRRTLEAMGHRLRGHCDTEIALHAYDAWGAGCLDRFRGMFAMAVWDGPNHRLFLARDRLGIKPLYYARRGDGFWFASELRALLAAGVVSPALSTEGLGSYLATGAARDPLTVLRDVRLLPPGHFGFVDTAGIELNQYWSLTGAFERAAPPRPRRAVVGQLRGMLEEAVRLHLVSDVGLGVFLSGGIDSSALVGLVARVAEQPPRTVSVVFPQQRFSEERHIRVVVERFGTRHTQVVLDEVEMLKQVPAAVSAMDQPTFDGANTYVVSGQARAAGLKVALAGLGGDELFAGYDSFRIVPRLEVLRRLLPAPARPLASGLTLRAMGDTDRARKLASWLRLGEPGQSALGLRRELFSRAAVARLLGCPPAPASHPEPPASWADPANQTSFLELDQYMRNILLRDTDVMSMAHGLEVRVPFLDHELVGFVAGLPGAQKVHGPTPKPLLVEALRDLLPAEVVNRRKMGFVLPFGHWLRGALRERIESALLDPGFGGPLTGLLDHAAVAEIWRRFLDGRTEWVRPWSIYALKAWTEELGSRCSGRLTP
jgi:asparagine synthase (glutamine-hydrolysing)